GKRLEVAAGATAADVAAAIGPGLARAALGARLDDDLIDLMTPVRPDARVAIVTKRDAEDVLFLQRHTLAHVLAQAVRELMVAEGHAASDVKMGVGPVIESGFYYDFDLPRTLTPDDLEGLEARMRAIIAAELPLSRAEVARDAALERWRASGDPYKVELIEDLPEDVAITFYTQGEAATGFTDLCRGPHVPNTGLVTPHFKLTGVAGAYWRGDERRPMMQRVYGVAFAAAEDLEHHQWQVEEARRRDHRKLGAELDIFVLDEDVGPGLPLWLPRGTVMVDELEKLAKEMEDAAGYKRVRSPHLSKEQLFLKSGHLPYYEDSMYPAMELDHVRYFVKPMNCPFHHKIYAARPRSYRDLPLRLAEYGTCYRYEDSGALMGLMRVRSMQMNDAHIYCTEEQFEAEFLKVIDLYLTYFELFGIEEYRMRLSKHAPEGLGKKYVDEPELWVRTEDMVRRAMTDAGIPFFEADDEAAFYGPKIDVQIKSAIGREFTLATNQVDFAQPGRFDLTYVDEHNQKRTPICLHRAPLSTHERMIGFLIEHFAGDFPLWLAPEQVRVVPIADRHVGPADELVARLAKAGLRAEVDTSNERMQAKIRDAELYKVPYVVILGDQEVDGGTVAFRSRQEPERRGVPVEAFVRHLEAHARARHRMITPLAL
ncbi:MAG: threonine--tRNA ligase, partial [Trueperaceae bacterium]|nr:threonine--tRNA ligase [Trueperaceae bacterium]